MISDQNMNELGLYEIYAQWHVPFWRTKTFYCIAGILILCLFGFIVRHVFKKYSLKKKPMLPWEIALAEIDHLKKNNYTNVEHAKEFYYFLTSILKRYMHERYGLQSEEKTDREFLQYLEQQEFNASFMQDLTSIFEGSTFIKFANASAAQQQIDQDFDAAISFIKKTIAPQAK